MARLKGANVNLDTGTAITCLNNEEFINQFVTTAGWITATDGATITFDLNAGPKQRVTLGGNRTLALSNVSDGKVFVLRLTQDATGSRTVTWFATIKWADGVAPTLTTTANKTDVFGFIQTGTGQYDAFTVGMAL